MFRKGRIVKNPWAAIGVIVPLLAVVVGWAWSVEGRLGTYQTTLDVSDRVKNLETLLVPLLVEYKVQERMKELSGNTGMGFSGPPMPPPPPSISYGDGVRAEPPAEYIPPEEEIREEAREWANEQMKQRL